MFHNKANLYGEELLATRPTPKLEDHPFSAVRDCLSLYSTIHDERRSSNIPSPTQNNIKITILYILIFVFFDTYQTIWRQIS